MTIETCPSDSKLGVVTNACKYSSPARLPVKRALFGQVDHDESIKFLNRELEAITERTNKKWNFDFRAEKALPGSYQWTKVESDEFIPRVYNQSRPHSISAQNHNTKSINNVQNCPVVTVPTKLPSKLIQTSIDDYLKNFKRLKTSTKREKVVPEREQCQHCKKPRSSLC